MKKIIVSIPEGKEKWKISFGGVTPFRRNSAAVAYNTVERKINSFLRTCDNKKTAIIVKYTDSSTNESLDSSDARYLLYSLTCFLEDYLTPAFFKDKSEKYLP